MIDTGGILIKTCLMGILPIGIREMARLNVIHITFDDYMGYAVGLTNDDVERMLDMVDANISLFKTMNVAGQHFCFKSISTIYVFLVGNHCITRCI